MYVSVGFRLHVGAWNDHYEPRNPEKHGCDRDTHKCSDRVYPITVTWEVQAGENEVP